MLALRFKEDTSFDAIARHPHNNRHFDEQASVDRASPRRTITTHY